MSTVAEEPKPRRVASYVVLALTALLLGFIAVRYRQAVAERKVFEQPAAASGAGAAAPTVAEPAAVSGSVRTIQPVALHWRPTVAATGTLTPIRESNLSFKVPGRLATVRAATGQLVKAGDLLASLDASDTAAQLRAANAQVHSAEVSLEIARDEASRSKNLLAQGAISDAQHRGNKQREEMAQAQLEAARAQADTVSAALENTRLVAPFAGLVTMAPSAPGAIISPPVNTTLFRIEDASALRFSGTLSVDDASLVRVGSPITLDNHALTGAITAILPSVDAQTRRVPMLAELKNDPKSPVLAGIFARATLRAEAPIDVLRLPPEALRSGSQNEVVLLVGGHARVVPVVFTRGEDGELLIRDGVRATDVVVLSPSSSVKTGDVVQLTAGSAG